MEEKEVLLTQEGFDKLEQELDSLKTTNCKSRRKNPIHYNTCKF